MKKKTIKKGGNTIISNIIGDKSGPFIPENIQNEMDLGNNKAIINKYKRIKEDAEKEYELALNKYTKGEAAANNTSKRFMLFITNVVGPVLNTILMYLGIIIKFLKYLIENGIKAGIYVVYAIRDIIKARGVVLVFLILIIIILVIIYIFYGDKINPFKGNNLFQNTKNLIIPFKDSQEDSPYNLLFKQMQNIIPIPDEYKNQFNKFKNDFYKFFGRDIVNEDIDTDNRETIDNGRYDGIYHIINNNESNVNTSNVYSIIKPKGPIVLYTNINGNIDYHKLPTGVKNLDKYNLNNYNISIPLNSNNGKYYYDIENADYVKSGTSTVIKSINSGNINPFITSNVIDPLNNKTSTYYNIKQIPIDKYLFSDKDNLKPQIFKEKLFSYNDTNYNYPINYVSSKEVIL
jgi:hypothetical protein